MPSPQPSPPLDNRHRVETPEGIDLLLRPAGLVPRALAFTVDLALRAAILLALFLGFGLLGKFGSGLSALLLFLVQWWYMVLFEVLNQGRTPGKQWLGLRVVHDDGTPVGWAASLTRNLLRFVDMLPFGYFLGALSCLAHPAFKRLGDLAAGTLVVYVERPGRRPALPIVEAQRPPVELDRDGQRALLDFAERQASLSPERAQELAALLAEPLHLPATQAVPGLLAMAQGLLRVTLKQEEFEQRHQAEWERFDAHLDALERRRTAPDDAMDFPAAYRRLCQQLALAEQRGYSSPLLEQLRRRVLRGHQQLYRQRSPLLGRLLGFVLGGFARLTREEWRGVFAASLLFYGSLLGMGVLVYAFPELAYSVLSADQVAEMETLYDPDASRLGRFGERGSAEDWMMFGYYVMNNIGIAFQTFAGGLLLGVGSLFFLMFNGLTIGAVAGHLSEIGYHQPFWSFVIGHGAFELTAITLAGAAGLKLGAALLTPGRLRRSEALRQAAERGVRLVAGATLMLLIAAFIEAYWSSMTYGPAGVKYAVGALLWLLVALYFLFAGRNHHASG